MATTGKKGKKSKGKTLALNEFLSEGPGGPPPAIAMVVPRKSQAWADEVENEDEFDYHPTRKENKVVLPTAPRATRSPTIDDEMVPRNPPYSAYISNLPYDVDQDEIAHFFKDLNIMNIRLPKDDKHGKLKGFGYVEFETRTNLINALKMGDSTIKSRRIRIEVADNTENDRRRGGRDFRDMGRDRSDGPDRTLGDWRSGPRTDGPSSDDNRDRDRGGDRGGDRDSSFSTRSTQQRLPREYGGAGGGFMERSSCAAPTDTNDRDRDRGFRSSGFGDRDRGGSSFGDRDRGGSSFGDRDRGSSSFGDRDRGSSSFGDRDRGTSSFGDRDRGTSSFGDRDRGSSFGDRDRGGSSFGDRDRDRYGSRDYGRSGGGFGPRRNYEEAPKREEDSSSEPKTRPRLNLQRRTLPVEETAEPTKPAAVAATKTAPSSSSIFGGAKPVDTAARERQIEERLAREKTDHPPSYRESKDAREPREPREQGDEPPQAWSRKNMGNGQVSPANTDDDRTNDSRDTSPSQANSKKEPTSWRPISDDKEERADSRGPPPRGGTERATAPTTKPQESERDISSNDNGQDEIARMPKYKEQQTPNFAGSNKYTYLMNDEEQEVSNTSDD